MVPHPGLEPGELRFLKAATLPICPAGRIWWKGLDSNQHRLPHREPIYSRPQHRRRCRPSEGEAASVNNTDVKVGRLRTWRGPTLRAEWRQGGLWRASPMFVKSAHDVSSCTKVQIAWHRQNGPVVTPGRQRKRNRTQSGLRCCGRWRICSRGSRRYVGRKRGLGLATVRIQQLGRGIQIGLSLRHCCRIISRNGGG